MLRVTNICLGLLVCFLTFLMEVAYGSECENVEEYSAIGTSDFPANTNINEALAEALTSIVADANTSYLNSYTETKESFENIIQSGSPDNIIYKQELTKRVLVRAGGYITDFNIIREFTDDDGFYGVEVVALVCKDPRVAVAITGDTGIATSFLGALADSLEPTQWTVTFIDSFHTNPTSEELISLSLQTGATMIANVHIHSQDQGDRRGLRAAEVVLDVNVFDIGVYDVLFNYSTAVSAKDNTLEGAQQIAVKKLGEDFASRLVSAFIENYPTSVKIDSGEFIFLGTQRSLNIRELVKIIPGVVTVSMPIQEAKRNAIRIPLYTWRDFCEVAESLEESVQPGIALESCDGNIAYLRVFR